VKDDNTPKILMSIDLSAKRVYNLIEANQCHECLYTFTKFRRSKSMEFTASMQLTEEQKQKALEYFKKTLQETLACPACGHDDWGLSDMLFQISAFRSTSIPPSPVIPLFPLTCAVCGHILLFNAIVMGLVKPPKEIDDEPAKHEQ
jgi:hypothetical protein